MCKMAKIIEKSNKPWNVITCVECGKQFRTFSIFFIPSQWSLFIVINFVLRGMSSRTAPNCLSEIYCVLRRSEKWKNPKSFLSHSDFCAVLHRWTNKKNEIKIRVREPCLKLTYIIQRKFWKIQRKIKGISFFAFSPVELVFYYSNGGLLNSLDTAASFDTHIDTFLN